MSHGPWGVVVVVVGVAITCLVTATADPDPATITLSMALVCGWLCCMVLVWCAAAALGSHWRLTREERTGWLTAAAVCGAVYLTSCTIRLYVGFVSGHGELAIEIVDVAMVGVWLFLARHAAVHPRALPRIGPIWLGLLLGLLGTALQALVYTLVHPSASAWREVPERVVIAGLGVFGLDTLRRARNLTESMRRQLIAICIFGTLCRVTAPAQPTRPSVATVVSLVCGVLAAATLCRVAAVLLIRARAQAEAISELAIVTAGGVTRSEQLHEVRASFAGLASAIRLLSGNGVELTPTRRTDLTTMLTAEVDRLERLLNGSPTASVPDVELDSVIGPIVIARQVTGQQVDWKPTGCHVEGSPDLIATAVNMLLVNAAIHARGSPVRVSAAPHGGVVRIRVTDNGPGVEEPVQRRLFVRGTRRPGSPGHGIGLHFAGRLAAVQGGSLHLADPRSGATTFELTLPRAHPREGR